MVIIWSAVRTVWSLIAVRTFIISGLLKFQFITLEFNRAISTTEVILLLRRLGYDEEW